MNKGISEGAVRTLVMLIVLLVAIAGVLGFVYGRPSSGSNPQTKSNVCKTSEDCVNDAGELGKLCLQNAGEVFCGCVYDTDCKFGNCINSKCVR